MRPRSSLGYQKPEEYAAEVAERPESCLTAIVSFTTARPQSMSNNSFTYYREFYPEALWQR